MPRFAIVTVVEAVDANEANEFARSFGTEPGAQWDHPLPIYFHGDPLEVAELDEYDTRSLVAAIATHPELPGGEGYTIYHVEGKGFTLGIGGAEYGPYDLPERDAIKAAFRDSASG
jgi:hypothetical protein